MTCGKRALNLRSEDRACWLACTGRLLCSKTSILPCTTNPLRALVLRADYYSDYEAEMMFRQWERKYFSQLVAPHKGTIHRGPHRLGLPSVCGVRPGTTCSRTKTWPQPQWVKMSDLFSDHYVLVHQICSVLIVCMFAQLQIGQVMLTMPHRYAKPHCSARFQYPAQ